MKPLVKSLILTASVSAFALMPLAVGTIIVTTDAAQAQGKGGGGGGGGGGSSNGGGGGGGSSNGGGGGGGSSNAGGGGGGGAAAANAGGGNANAAANRARGNSGGGGTTTTTTSVASAPATASAQGSDGGHPSDFGKIRAELKGLNAANAAPQAFANAAPDSQVGRIATYYNAALATEGLADLEEAKAELGELEEAYDGRNSEEIEADIIATEALLGQLDPGSDNYALNPDSENFDEDLAELNDEELTELEAQLEAELAELNNELAAPARIAELEGIIEAYEDEEAALLAATGGETLSEEALEELRRLLGL